MTTTEFRFKPWRPPKGEPHYERSFDNGAAWQKCSQRDIFNSFSALKEILRELDKGLIVRSVNGVLYRRRKDMMAK